MADKQRILIVDDDTNIAELIELYLTKECFQCEQAHDLSLIHISEPTRRP